MACLSIAIAIAGCGSSNPAVSNGGTPQSPATLPLAVTSISPTSVPAGAAAQTLAVNGSGFQSTSAVQINGVSVPTTYVRATQLTAVVPASSLATGAMLQVAVLNGSSSSASAAQRSALKSIIQFLSLQVFHRPVFL
ncbi:IPT/TIG domain-containing protein [Edaphobacter modestus]